MIRVNATITSLDVFVPKASCPKVFAARGPGHVFCKSGETRCPHLLGFDDGKVLCGGATHTVRVGQDTVMMEVPVEEVRNEEVTVNTDDGSKAKGKVKRVDPDGTVEVQTETPPNTDPGVMHTASPAGGTLRRLWSDYSAYPDPDPLIAGVMDVLAEAGVGLNDQVRIETDLEQAGRSPDALHGVLSQVYQLVEGRPGLV